jgi:hypothetical protein
MVIGQHVIPLSFVIQQHFKNITPHLRYYQAELSLIDMIFIANIE